MFGDALKKNQDDELLTICVASFLIQILHEMIMPQWLKTKHFMYIQPCLSFL